MKIERLAAIIFALLPTALVAQGNSGKIVTNIAVAAADPATCSTSPVLGESALYWNTASAALKGCSATNVWSSVVYSSGGTTNLVLSEGVCSGAATGFTVVCSDATLHALKTSFNNGAFVAVPQLAGDLGNTAASPQVVSTHITGTTTNLIQKASSGNMVNSSITDNGTTITTAEPIGLGDGGSSTQSIYFTATGQGAGKAGFWRDSTAAVGITAMHMSDGSCTSPGYAWANTGSLGFDRNSATEIAVCANGQIGALGTTLKWGSGSPFQVTSAGAISTTATTNQVVLGSTTVNAPATTAVTVNQPILLSNTGAYAAIASTNSETFFAIGTDGKIPSGAINAAGRRIEMEFAGIYGTNGVTDTINLKFKLCTVSGCGSGTVVQVATTGVVTPGAAVTNQGWSARVVCNVYTSGASGTIDCQGLPGAVYFTALTTVILDDIVNTATSTVDTTVNEFVSASATWNNNSGNNTITLRNFAAKVF